MSFFCPECGTEVETGVLCPECGHMDESCPNCGDFVGDNSWKCQSCATPRTHCPECGMVAKGETCDNCGAKRPAECVQCGEIVDRDSPQCSSCNYHPGAKTRRRARIAKYLGIGIPAFLFLITPLMVLDSGTVSAYTIGSALFGAVIIAAVPSGVLFLLSRRWGRKAADQTVDEVPS